MTSDPPQGKPSYVVDLEKAYGGPSQSAFGSSVFYDPADAVETAASLEQAALTKYEHFCGETWERFGEANWRGAWGRVYTRAADAKHDILAELRSIPDSGVKLSASMLLDNNDQGVLARRALSSAFDDAKVAELHVYTIGDGAAMSGLLIAARRPTEGSLFLVFLMD